MSRKVSFIHTADVHLGRKFQDLGGKGALLRKRIERAFEKTVDLALDRSADLMLVAGDLFDSPEPPLQALAVVKAAAARLKAAGTKMVIAPGTHDPPRSRVFSDPLFRENPRDLVLLTPDRPSVILDELDLAVCSWFPDRERAREWIGPAEGWHNNRTFRLAMAHGSVLPAFDGPVPDDLIAAEILSDPEVNYLALGHHHGTRPVTGTKAPAYYSGAPEKLALDQKDAGNALYVLLSETGGGVKATVETVPVGSLAYRKLAVDAAELMAGRDLAKELADLAGPDLFLEVEISGAAPLDARLPDWKELEDGLAGSFFRLRIRDRAGRTDPRETMAAAPGGSVTAEFIERVQKRIAGSKGDERAEWEEALSLGIHYLTGRDRSG